MALPIDTIIDWHLNNLPYKVMWMDQEGRIVYTNKKFCDQLGYSKNEFLKLSIFDINPSSTKEGWQKHWKQVEKEKLLKFKAVHQTKRGGYFDVEIYAQFFSYNGNKVICAVVNDISESSFYMNLFHHAEKIINVGGWTLNLQDGTIIVTDQAFCIFETEDTSDFLPGKVIQFFEQDQQLKEMITKAIRHGADYDEVLTLKLPSGIQKQIRCVGQPIIKNDKIYKLVGAYQDVTSFKENEEQLKLALAELNVLKSELETDNQYLIEEINTSNFEDIICKSQAYQRILQHITQVAVTDSTVLITGESGTGKELIANAIHQNSLRNNRPFIKVNCATLQKELIESELFGHKKGAFTGAISDKVGKFTLADGGTIFLDEIGEVPIELQPKLLRVLQEGEFDQLGGTKTSKVDVRVVAATNRDLEVMVKEGTFREDLYYRLNVFPIHNISLRERKDDIPLLAQFFLEKYALKIGKSFKRISKKATDLLMSYSFPGNIRELKNIIERAVIMEQGTTLYLESWSPKLEVEHSKTEFITFEESQKAYLTRVLNHTNWRVSGPKGAAKILDMKDKTLFATMKRLGIKRELE